MTIIFWFNSPWIKAKTTNLAQSSKFYLITFAAVFHPWFQLFAEVHHKKKKFHSFPWYLWEVFLLFSLICSISLNNIGFIHSLEFGQNFSQAIWSGATVVGSSLVIFLISFKATKLSRFLSLLTFCNLYFSWEFHVGSYSSLYIFRLDGYLRFFEFPKWETGCFK